MKNQFIVFEGIDGSGTSTQLKQLENYFSTHEIPALFTAEPTSNPIGLLIRRYLKGELQAENSTLASLFTADRMEHLHGKGGIIEALKAGKWVICDRFHFSTLAYQSLTVPMEQLYRQNKDFLLPDHLFFIDTPFETADQRITHRNQPREIYEKPSLQKQIRENYFEAFEFFKNPKMQINLLDGEKEIEFLHQEILQILSLKN